MEVNCGSQTILVVDDEPMVLQLAGSILRRFNYSVLAAEEGHAAIELFQQRRSEIAAVLLDIVMPGMDGKKVFAELLARDPRAVIILSSGYPQDNTIDELLEQGAAAFIQKPYRITDLVSVVEKAIQRKQEEPALACQCPERKGDD